MNKEIMGDAISPYWKVYFGNCKDYITICKPILVGFPPRLDLLIGSVKFKSAEEAQRHCDKLNQEISHP